MSRTVDGGRVVAEEGNGSDRARVSVPMRVVLVLAAVLVFAAGLQLTVFATRTDDWFAWTIDVEMTALFLGAAYWSSAVLEIAGVRAAGWDTARLTVWPVLVFTVLTMAVTLWHLDRFHLGAEHPDSARAVAVGWLLIYTGVPVAMVLALAWQRRAAGVAENVVRHRLPAALARPLLALAAVLVLGGAALLVAPAWADAAWPWSLTPLTGRAIGAWLVGLGWAAAQAWLIDDVRRIRPLGWTGVVFVALQSIALLRAGGGLDWSGWPGLGYVAGLAWIGVVSVWILVTAAAAAGRGRSR